MSERETEMVICLHAVEGSLNQKNIREETKKQIVELSALKQSENIVEIARERRIKLKLSNNLTCICFSLDNRTESVCPGQSQVATSALISLLPYVSVGMQRVSSLRTQRVAGSCTECEARKKEHD